MSGALFHFLLFYIEINLANRCCSRRLVWVCTVCICHKNGTLGEYGLISLLKQAGMFDIFLRNQFEMNLLLILYTMMHYCYPDCVTGQINVIYLLKSFKRGAATEEYMPIVCCRSIYLSAGGILSGHWFTPHVLCSMEPFPRGASPAWRLRLELYYSWFIRVRIQEFKCAIQQF